MNAQRHLKECCEYGLDRDDDHLPCRREVLEGLRDGADEMHEAVALKVLADLYAAMARKALEMADDARKRHHGRQQ